MPYDQVVSLDCTNRDISSLQGIESLTSLNALFMAQNQIADLSPLQNMNTLNTLQLSSNNKRIVNLIACV